VPSVMGMTASAEGMIVLMASPRAAKQAMPGPRRVRAAQWRRRGQGCRCGRVPAPLCPGQPRRRHSAAGAWSRRASLRLIVASTLEPGSEFALDAPGIGGKLGHLPAMLTLQMRGQPLNLSVTEGRVSFTGQSQPAVPPAAVGGLGHGVPVLAGQPGNRPWAAAIACVWHHGHRLSREVAAAGSGLGNWPGCRTCTLKSGTWCQLLACFIVRCCIAGSVCERPPGNAGRPDVP